MHKQSFLHLLNRKVLSTVALGVICIVGSFRLGIETVGEVHPFDRSNAAQSEPRADIMDIAEDIDGDGIVTENDASEALQIALGYKKAETWQLRRVPGGRITEKTALAILQKLRVR